MRACRARAAGAARAAVRPRVGVPARGFWQQIGVELVATEQASPQKLGVHLASASAQDLPAGDELVHLRLQLELELRHLAIEGGTPINYALDKAHVALSQAGFRSIDYISACDAQTLEPFEQDKAPEGREGRLLLAAWMGATRLIDNLAFCRPAPAP